MRKKHQYILRYTQDMLALAPADSSVYVASTTETEFVFFESEEDIDWLVVETEAKKAWAGTLATVAPHTAFKVRDPVLSCITTFADVKWE